MGRRKKKKYIPWSQWTPVVQGLNSDVADSSTDGANLGSSFPIETLDEGNEVISEEESCQSSNGDTQASDTSIDGEVELQIESEVAERLLLHENLDVQDSRCSPSPDQGDSMVNPNSSNSQKTLDAPISLIAESHEAEGDLILNSGIDNELPCPTRSDSVEPILVQRNKSQGTGSVQASIMTDKSLQPPKAFETGEPYDLHSEKSMELDGQKCDSYRGKSTKADACDATHSENQGHQSAVDINAPPIDGFKKAPNRRKKKKIASTDNPEHHQDKPEAMISS
ncbi:hypothetical protein Dimus_036974 [Dionaea muscipula]